MSEHSPAPWRVEVDSTCSAADLVIRPADYLDGEIADLPPFATETRKHAQSGKAEIYLENPRAFQLQPDADEVLANAALIGAAPELLKACKSALAFLHHYQCLQTWGGGYELMGLLQAAVAAAEFNDARFLEQCLGRGRETLSILQA
jgi:hypothetical protein